MIESTFNIKMKLDKRFLSKINELKSKYGEELEHLNGFHNNNLNFTDFIDHFVRTDTAADATIDPNANSSSKDICSLIYEMSKPHRKLLAFNKIYYEICKKYGTELADSWLEDEWNGAYYMHDATDVSFKPYCYAFSLKDLAEKGLFFVEKYGSGKPKHYTTFIRDVFEFVSWTSNRQSGAVGLPDVIPYLWYFWWNDVKNNYYTKDPDYYRDQGIQELVYAINQPALRVNQSAFTNVTIMDKYYLEQLFGGLVFPDGETLAIEHLDEIMEFQKHFMKVCSEIRNVQMFTFPVITFSLLLDKDTKFADEEFARWACSHNMKWNDANFFMSKDITSLSSCCRLVNDFSKLNGFINSIGGTALRIGSLKVNTINLARIALETKTKEEYIEKLRDRTIRCIKVLDVVRSIIQRDIEKGLLPNYQDGLMDINTQFNTIGINAMFEAVERVCGMKVDQFGNYSYTDDGFKFAKRILEVINEVKEAWKTANNIQYSCNIEAIPGERAAVIFAKKDAILFNIENPEPIYGNQWIPLTKKANFSERLRLAKLDSLCGGGQILHLNLDANFPNEDEAWKMLCKIAKSGVIYFAFNTKIKTCSDQHAWTGDSNICPVCGKPLFDTWQRIVGFLTPSKSYSKERKAEFSERYWYNLNDR